MSKEKSIYEKWCHSYRCNGNSTAGVIIEVPLHVDICPKCGSYLVTRKSGSKRRLTRADKHERRIYA